jgi:hypothetical protein
VLAPPWCDAPNYIRARLWNHSRGGHRGPASPEMLKRPVTYRLRTYGAPYGIRTRVTALRGPCPRPLDEGSGLADLWALGPRGAGSIRTNFLDSSGTPLFELIADATPAPGYSQV